MNTRKYLSIISVSLILILLASCSGINISGTPTPTSQIITPSLEDNTVSTTGEVVPGKWVNLSFPSSGQNLQILVEAGQFIIQDTLIAQVDDLSAVSAYKAANAQVANAVATLYRLNDQKAKGLDLSAAQDALAAAEANLDVANQALENTKLYSPFSGTIVEINANNGEFVAPGQPLIIMADFSTLQVQTSDMSEVDAVRIRKGDIADISFDAFPNMSVTGKVYYIALKKSSGSGVYYTVTLILDKIPEDLRWGMSAFTVIHLK